MKVCVIYGQSHQGSTYHMARYLAEQLGQEIREVFLPRDFHEFCVGCKTCFLKGEEFCPHAASVKPITEAIDEADVIILASPVYVFHPTGAMKSLLDHLAFRWMAHRPEEKMFAKQGVTITGAAGMGMKKTAKDMADSLFFWGISRLYSCPVAVAAMDWDHVSPRKKERIEKRLSKIAKAIRSREGRVTPTWKGRFMFSIMRKIQQNGWNPKDKSYWEAKGWLGKKRPWKD